MESRLDTTLIQHVATKGFQLFGKLLDVSKHSCTVGRNDIRDVSIEVAFTSSVLNHFVETMKHSNGEIRMGDQITQGGLSTANGSASACARVFDEIERRLIESLEGPHESFRPMQDSLRSTLGEARRILTIVIQGTLQHHSEEPRLRSSDFNEALYNHTPLAKTQVPPFERSSGIYRGASNPNTGPALSSPLNPSHRYDPANVVHLGADGPSGTCDQLSLAGVSSFTMKQRVKDSPGISRKQYTENSSRSRGRHELEEEQNSNDSSILRTCAIVPTIRSLAQGYDVEWLVTVMPFQESEVRKEFRRLRQMDSRSVCEQLDSLTRVERCALEEFIALTPLPPTTSRWPHEEHVVLLAVVVEHIQPPEELEWYLGRVSKRRVKIVLKTKRHLNAQDHAANSNGYPWVKVHRKYMSPRLLNDRGLPWEWDSSNPNYIIIKRWIPQNELDVLFDRSQDMLQSQNLILKASPPLDPYKQAATGLEQGSETNAVIPRRRFCKPLTYTLVRLGFIKEDNKEDIAKGAIGNHNKSQDLTQYYNGHDSNPGESAKVAELCKTRKDIEIEIKELERQKIELRIQKRNQEKQCMVNHIPYLIFFAILLN